MARADFNPQRMGLCYSYPTNYTDWADAFLSGNGKMGIMVFGNPLHETTIFNDRAFNLAKNRDRSFAQVSPADLETIRSNCAAGNFAEANRLAVSSAHYGGGGDGNRHPGYEMIISIPKGGAISNYSRICNFRTGEIAVNWADSRGTWLRRSFVSRKDNVIVQYLTAPTKGKLNCAIELGIDPKMSFQGMNFVKDSSADCLNFRAKYPGNANDVGYEGVTRIVTVGGTESVKDNAVIISNANSVILLTRIAKYYTNAKEHFFQKNLQKQLAAMTADYGALLKGQIATHQAIYDRVKIDLHASAEDRARSNEELLATQKKSPEAVNALWERIFDAGRYYYLSSSSELTPPDLLGIWTGDCNAGWGGYYHLDANLNLQIAGGNIGDMSEAMEGYFKINESWREGFQTNAQKLLGCRGMVAAGNTPGTGAGLMANINDFYPYQYATGEEPWLLYPFWEHYLITGDTNFLLNRLYPLLKDMGYFYEDFLTKTDTNGHYILAGSVSPENQPSNVRISLLNNSTFDLSGARFALGALIQTCNMLGLEQGAGQGVERWNALFKKLPPYLINEDGALQEWSWPGLKDNYAHRHSSGLMPIWPYREFTPETDSVLFKAAATTLQKKDAYDYENAGHGILHSALIAVSVNNDRSVNKKLLRLTKEDFYYNSLCSSHYRAHGVFCTDACNAVPGIMMEMLVSSRPGVLELLPAVPQSLTEGAISGVKGRNRVTVKNLSWNLDAGTIKCTLRSDIDQDLTIVQRREIRSLNTKAKVSPSPFGQIARIVHLRAGVSTDVSFGLGVPKSPERESSALEQR